MPLAKQSSKELSCHQSHSQIRQARQTNPPSDSDIRLLTPPQENIPQPAKLKALPGLMAKAAALFAEHAATAFPNLLLAFLSWLVSEFLAGCAAYAAAICPPPPTADERMRSDVALPTAYPALDIAPLKAKPSLIAIAGDRNRSIGSKELRFRAEQTLLARLRRGRARRQALEELRGLDDRTLRDIGISRCDFERIASDGACRE